MKTLVRAALAAATVAALGSATALANPITFTSVGPSVEAPRGGVFTLTKFDPSLGTLKQVDLTWTTYASVNAQINQTGAGSANLADAGLKFTFNAPQVSITSLNVPSFLFAWPDATPNPYIIAPSSSAAVGSGQQVNSANWAPYTGLGTFNVGWAIEEFSRGPGVTWVGEGGFQSGLLDARLGGYEFSVTYNYDPVPEPGSMLLLGTGLVGLGRAWRKRRNA
jgi:hypothetical protein